MSGSTDGSRMLQTYFMTVMVSWINIRGHRVSYAITPFTIAPVVGAVCRCTANSGLRRSSWGLHTRTDLSSQPKFSLDSSLKAIRFYFVAVQYFDSDTNPKGDDDEWVLMGGRRSPSYNCSFYICPVYRKRISVECVFFPHL
ncbi:hypothetical protein TNCV_4363691 [Trichonephila clavipes]|nr:hypothetical protein TNCV_4363691 [Trichonephila clavipes]